MRMLLRPINVLLLAGPLGILSVRLGWGAGITFLVLALAIVPLAGLISSLTDTLAERVGDRVGGLLEATFGNAAFIILGVLALAQGLSKVVQASIAGAIISNTLFVLGAAFFFGCLRGQRQRFSAETAGNYAKLLALAVVALVLPAIAEASTAQQGDVVGKETSAVAAVILILLYGAYLLYDLFHFRDFAYHEQLAITRKRPRPADHPAITMETAPIAEERAEQRQRLTALRARRERLSAGEHLPAWAALLGLAVVIVVTVYLSELLVEVTRAITLAGEPIVIGGVYLGTLKLTETFVGLVIIPLIGTAAEHLSAIRSALSGRTEITIAVTAGAAIQVALLAAPLFVLLSFFVGPTPFVLVFSAVELAVFALATFLFYLVTEDGEGTWLEGTLLLAFYLIFAGTAFFLP